MRCWDIDLADFYTDLTADEKSVHRYIKKENGTPPIKNIKETLGITDYANRKATQPLEKTHLI